MIYDRQERGTKMEAIRKIRLAEAKSHTEAYSNLQLFAPGSWLAKPVKTVMDLLPLIEGYTGLCITHYSVSMMAFFLNWL